MALSDTDLQSALQLWSQGDHPNAVETLRPAADEGDRVALTFVAWFQSQRGEPHWREGVAYAEQAVQKGVPAIANYYIGNMLADPALRTRVPDLLRSAAMVGSTLDPLAYVMQPIGQGDLPTGVRIAAVAGTPTIRPEGWSDLVSRVTEEWDEISASVSETQTAKNEALEAIASDRTTVSDLKATVESRTSQLVALIEQTTSAEVQSFFDKEATRYEGEARRAWWSGIGMLAAAALFAVAPIVIYYVGEILDRNWLADQNLTAAHFAPALALGALAGVLLARARGRDRARQRAQDLSVALVTMFVYSGQITDPAERQRFLHDMGRTVLEAFLRQDGGSAERDSTSLLSALAQQK